MSEGKSGTLLLGPTPSNPPDPPVEKKSTLASAGIISIAVLASRVLGVLRESLRAGLLGAGFYGDAYVIAFRIPNLLRDLFAEGALSAAFVPTFTDHLVNRSKEEAHSLASLTLGIVLVVTGAIALLGIVFAEQVVAFIAPGFAATPGKRELTAHLAAIMMPFLPMVSVSAVLMGMQNAYRQFFLPALAPAVFNVSSVLVAVVLYLFTSDVQTAAIGWSAGVLLGGLCTIATQMPSLWRLGFRFRPTLSGAFIHPGVRRIARLMAPAIAGLGAVQLNILVNSMFASKLGDGPVAWLDYAFRLYFVPVGLFGVALGTVTQTNVAEDAARNDLPALRKSLAHSLKLVFFLTLPATAGLIAIAQPCTELLFEYGRFTAADSEATSQVLCAYVAGLAAAASVKILVPAFYALDASRVALMGSFAAVVVNISFNAVFWNLLGAPGIALGTAVGALVNAGLLFAAAGRRLGGWKGEGILRNLLLTALASVLVGLVAYWSQALVGLLWPPEAGPEILRRAVRVVLPVLLAVVLYLPYCERIGIEETRDLRDALSRLRRRLRREGARTA
ncbi:MAG: murein biosynthesis integral membrane protein MurJ [Bdellovibrionota bacterium]